MSKATHTPGPFSVERQVRYSQAGFAPDHCGVEIHANGAPIGVWFDGEWDGHGPNSDLFAAAPDLLEACRRAHAYLADIWDATGGAGDIEAIGTSTEIESAIAKAEGGEA